jgi:hypothetical protein
MRAAQLEGGWLRNTVWCLYSITLTSNIESVQKSSLQPDLDTPCFAQGRTTRMLRRKGDVVLGYRSTFFSDVVSFVTWSWYATVTGSHLLTGPARFVSHIFCLASARPSLAAWCGDVTLPVPEDSACPQDGEAGNALTRAKRGSMWRMCRTDPPSGRAPLEPSCFRDESACLAE